MNNAHFAYIVAGVCAAAFLILLVKQWLERVLARSRSRLRNRRAARGEKNAEPLLESLGYVIEARQAPAAWTVVVGGRDHEVALRADLIVRRGKARFVAEVKTGNTAPRLTTAATRRQLLEYRIAYDVDGVLLVDVEAGRVMDVEFPLAGREKAPRLPVLTAFVAGTAAGFALAHWLIQ